MHARHVPLLLAAAGLWLGGFTTTPASAAPRPGGAAKVVSVDGPTSVTIKNRKGQRIALRLTGIDAPRAGECGATETQAALEQILAGRLDELRYKLTYRDGKQPERDPDGRYVGALTYYPPKDPYNRYAVGARLVDLGWARSGIPASLDSPTPRNLWTAVESEDDLGRARDRQGRPRGLWARCGGRLHLPAEQPVPSTAAVPWTTTDRGITTAVGALKLPGLLTPETTLTLRRVAAQVGDLELVRVQNACLGVIPSVQVVVYAWTVDRPGTRCGDADVQAVTSYGPGTPSLDRGPRVGESTRSIPAAYPLVDDFAFDADTDSVPLSGGEFHAWAWQTRAELDERGRIGWFTAYAVAPVFE